MMQRYITPYWPGSSGIKSYANQDPVLYNSMLVGGSFRIKSLANHDSVLYNSMLARFVRYKFT